MKAFIKMAALCLALSLAAPVGAVSEGPVASEVTDEQFRAVIEMIEAESLTVVTERAMMIIAAQTLLADTRRADLSADAARVTDVKGFLRLAASARKNLPDGQPRPPLLRNALNAVLASLDGDSNSLQSMATLRARTSAVEFGLYLGVRNNALVVATMRRDAQGWRSGVRSGDRVLRVDDQAVTPRDLQAVTAKLDGDLRSRITLTLLRDGAAEPFEVQVERQRGDRQSVKTRIFGDIVLISVDELGEDTAQAVRDALDRASGEARGYILDLRDSPGGLLDQVVMIADLFTDGGEVVAVRGREPHDLARYNARPGDKASGRPLVLLINQGTAAGAEMIAAALADRKRAVLVGSKTYGAGMVRTVFPVQVMGEPRSDVALILNTARMFTPSGASFDKVGLEPDVTLEEQTQAGRAPRIRADFKQAGGFDAASLAAATTDSPDIAGLHAEPQDAQLAYAIRLLRGLALTAGD